MSTLTAKLLKLVILRSVVNYDNTILREVPFLKYFEMEVSKQTVSFKESMTIRRAETLTVIY